MDTKICRTCGREKPLEAFRWQGTSPNGKRYRSGQCNPCRNAPRRQQTAAKRAARLAAQAPAPDVGTKICKVCKQEKPLTAFGTGNNSNVPGYRSPTCKRCYNAPYSDRYTPRTDKPTEIPTDHKWCNRCGLIQSLQHFSPHKRSVRQPCKACRRERRRMAASPIRAARALDVFRRVVLPIPEEEICWSCGGEKAVTDFYIERRATGSLKVRRQCKTCRHLYRVQYYQAHRQQLIFRAVHGRDLRIHAQRQALRNALQRGATHGVIVDRQAIIARDGSRCHVCHRIVREDITLDHLIPLSKGGIHNAQHLAVACRSCNAKRGDGRLPAQLRLFGYNARSWITKGTLTATPYHGGSAGSVTGPDGALHSTVSIICRLKSART